MRKTQIFVKLRAVAMVNRKSGARRNSDKIVSKENPAQISMKSKTVKC